MRHPGSETARRSHRHRRSSHGKCFPGACRRTHRHRWNQGNCFGSVGCPPPRRRRSGHRCSASGCRHSAVHPAGSRRRSHSDRRSDRRSAHSGRLGHRGCHLDCHRTDYHHRPDRHPANRRSSVTRQSCCRRTAAACSSRFARRTNCGPEKMIASHPGSALKSRRCRRRPRTACWNCYGRKSQSHPTDWKGRRWESQSRPTASRMTARPKKTIAAAAEGSRPSGMRTLHRLPSPGRRPRAEICASAEFASFLLIPPPHTATAAAVAECATGQLNAG
jgi:hypothetical protein